VKQYELSVFEYYAPAGTVLHGVKLWAVGGYLWVCLSVCPEIGHVTCSDRVAL